MYKLLNNSLELLHQLFIFHPFFKINLIILHKLFLYEHNMLKQLTFQLKIIIRS